MPARRLPLRKTREILRLLWQLGLGVRKTARSCQTSHATVVEYRQRAEAAGLDAQALGRGRTGGCPPRPPHRSQRAGLLHWAPASGGDAQALIGIWMKDSRLRQALLCEPVEPFPRESVFLAAAPKRSPPVP